jgi:O-antigen ligase
MAAWWLGLGVPTVAAAWHAQGRFVIGAWGLTWITFGLFLLGHALWLSPTYQAEGVYLAATFLLPFLYAAVGHEWLVRHGFLWLCIVVGALASWAILQWLTGWGYLDDAAHVRAQASFATPNTLATVINLALAPLLAYYLLGRGDGRAYGLLLLLFAGLLATQSRGGYLALLIATACLAGYVGKPSLVSNARRWGAVLLGFAGVMAAFRLYAWLGPPSWSLDNVEATLLHGEHSGRLQLYALAWPLFIAHFWKGLGYFHFGQVFEMHKVAPYLDATTRFVHDDYLQLALETGIGGIGLFLALIGALYRQLWCHRARVLHERRLAVILPAMAVTSMLTHALVDFPFYVPLPLALFAAYAGILDQQWIALGGRAWRPPPAPLMGMRAGFIQAMVLLLGLGWLALPALAEASAAYGLHRLRQGDASGGLYWHQVARILQPRDAAYHWREGVILRDLGVVQQDGRLLALADRSFAQGLAVNPYAVDNLLARLALHREQRDLLPSPVSQAELLAWARQAERLQPHSDAVAVEVIRVLAFVGQQQEAVARAQRLLERRPESLVARNLLSSVSAGR